MINTKTAVSPCESCVLSNRAGLVDEVDNPDAEPQTIQCSGPELVGHFVTSVSSSTDQIVPNLFHNEHYRCPNGLVEDYIVSHG